MAPSLSLVRAVAAGAVTGAPSRERQRQVGCVAAATCRRQPAAVALGAENPVGAARLGRIRSGVPSGRIALASGGSGDWAGAAPTAGGVGATERQIRAEARAKARAYVVTTRAVASGERDEKGTERLTPQQRSRVTSIFPVARGDRLLFSYETPVTPILSYPRLLSPQAAARLLPMAAGVRLRAPPATSSDGYRASSSTRPSASPSCYGPSTASSIRGRG